MLLATFIVLGIIAAGLLPLSFMAAATFKGSNFSLKLRVRLAGILTLFGWDSGEEGFDFLFKKRVKKEKKKKKRVNRIIRGIFNPESLVHIKGMATARFEIRGVIATHDAAGTALIYGSICAVLSTVIPHLNRSRVLADFYPDFQKKEPDLLISCIIRIRIIHIIYLIARLYIGKYLKGRWHSLWNRIQYRT